MTPVPITLKILIFIGRLTFACIYGTLGIILTLLRFFKIGPKRFFRRVERSTPPSKAIDPAYGTHEMLKLKVD